MATQTNVLTPAYFQNIDEIRIVGASGSKIFPAINLISLNTTTALPVSLKDFTGTQINNEVAITWLGVVEDVVNRYEVQQSKDANTFITVASLNPKGNGTSYKKIIPFTGAGDYFRLRILKTDNTVEYSKVINIINKSYITLSLHPNPASQYIYINSSKEGVAAIIDGVGRKVKTIPLNQGINQVDISGLASGLYYFVLNDQKINFIKK